MDQTKNQSDKRTDKNTQLRKRSDIYVLKGC